MALSVETVAETALRILSDFGLGDLTMRRLARELGVQPSALYWHVADKQSLFVLLAERIAAEAEAGCRPPAEAAAAGRVDQSVPTGAVCRTRNAAAGERLTRILTFRTVLLRYRESAEIVILAYSINGASVLPTGLHDLDADLREQVVAFVLGSVAVEQSRTMLGGGPHGTDPAETFRAGLLTLLTAVPAASPPLP